MAGFGRPPKPEGQRRTRHVGLGGGQIRRLPRSEHADSTPEWPLGRPSKREAAIWERLWLTPQSAEWERLGWADVVARYARVLAVAEQRGAPITLLGEARQLEDRLGLSPMALLRLRWEVVDDREADQAEASVDEGVLDIRERLQAVD